MHLNWNNWGKELHETNIITAIVRITKTASKNTHNKIGKKISRSTGNQNQSTEHSIKWNLTLADVPMLNQL